MSIRIEGIGDGLSEIQKNALAILTNLPLERFGKLKKDTLKLSGSPDLLDVETLAKFIATDELTTPSGLVFQTTYAKGEIMSQLNEIKTRGYEDLIMEAAEDFDIQPSVIGGLGSRESLWGLILNPRGPAGTGDGGHGRGLSQIDDVAHEFARTGNWQNPRANIRYGCDLLADNRAVLKREGLSGRQLLKAVLASYNAGLGAVLLALDRGVDVDSVTTGDDDGKDVLDRAGWFETFDGWK